MKSITKVLIGTLALVFLQNQTNAQSTQNGLGAAGHFNLGGVAGYYLGWNAASTIPLNIEHRGTDDINFLTGGTNRMVIKGTSVPATAGFVGIGANNFFATNSPLTMLHLEGVNISPGTTAWRNWMKTGMFMKENTDNMYVGVKTVAPDISYAIISWGDNNAGVGAVDLLSFNFTGTGAGGLEASADGMETMRVTPNPEKGTLGVGNFQNIGISKEPVRRVEILDASPVTGVNQKVPQLRLTYTYDDNVLNGIFSEFQTTSTGDLYFNTRNNTVAQNFGFHKSTPLNCVEINSHTGNPGFGSVNGSSGLRFTNMTSANSTVANPGTGVLSVDANGDVIYVPGTSTGNNGVFINATGAAQLGVPCNSSPTVKFNNGLTTDRVIHMRGNNFIFGDGGRVGIGLTMAGAGMSCAVGNKLEIINTAGNPYFTAGGAGSGLRFRYLTSASAVTPNGTNGVNSSKVLSVDQNGDVVLTDATPGPIGPIGPAGPVGATGATGPAGPAGGITNAQNGTSVVGNIVELGTNPLLHNTQIPLNNWNLLFTDPISPSLFQNHVGIGTISPQGKLHVVTNDVTTQSALYVEHTSITATQNIGVLSVSAGPSSRGGVFLGSYIGIAAEIIPNNTSNLQTGVLGLIPQASSGQTNRGVDGSAMASGNPNAINIGVNGKAFNGLQNIGISGTAPVNANSWAGSFNGNVFINGAGTSPGPGLIFSDKNLKDNVTTLTFPIDQLSKLRPVSFNLDNHNAPQLNVDVNKTYGLIAQEVESVIPELVKDVIIPATYDSLGAVINPSVTVKSLNYTGLIPFAIAGIQGLNIRQQAMQVALDKAGLSDAQVKTNVNTFNALATVKTLHPVKYNFTNANVPQLTFKPNTDYGFIAQQLETVYPELVDTMRVAATYDSTGVVVNPSKVLKTVNYKAMSALLVRSIQEQQLTIDSLRNAHSKQDSINNAVQQQLANLASLIDGCCHASSSRQSNSNINQLDIELSDKDVIVLNQNVPNPFAEQTSITYNVPASVGKAQLIFFNTNGQVIQTVDIKTRGKGKVNVFASDLSSGLYNYSLVADGKVIDSKKMVRE